MENNSELSLNASSINHLKESAKWSYFLSIIGFISLGIIVTMALFIKAIFSIFPSNGPTGFGAASLPFTMMSVMYIIIAIIYFFPILYLYKFSSKIKNAIKLNDSIVLEDAFKNLKSHYKFIGIFMIVMLSLYALIFVVSIGSMAIFR